MTEEDAAGVEVEGIRGRVYCRRIALAGRLVSIVSIFFLAAATTSFARSGGYDPRTWSYDPDSHVLVSPSGEAGQAAAVPQWHSIPREVVRFSESLPAGSVVFTTATGFSIRIVERGIT